MFAVRFSSDNNNDACAFSCHTRIRIFAVHTWIIIVVDRMKKSIESYRICKVNVSICRLVSFRCIYSWFPLLCGLHHNNLWYLKNSAFRRTSNTAEYISTLLQNNRSGRAIAIGKRRRLLSHVSIGNHEKYECPAICRRMSSGKIIEIILSVYVSTIIHERSGEFTRLIRVFFFLLRRTKRVPAEIHFHRKYLYFPHLRC